MERKQALAEILNDLAQINNDRIVGYEKAISELKDEYSDLKSFFLGLIAKSRSYKMALSTELNVMETETEADTTTSSKIYRAWLEVKALFTGHDRDTILSNCEYGEDAAQKAYKMALEQNNLQTHLRSLITEQKLSLKSNYDQIRALKNEHA